MPSDEEMGRVSASIRAMAQALDERDNAPVATRDAVLQLNDSVGELNIESQRLNNHVMQVEWAVAELAESVGAFHRASDRSSRVMIWLTGAILLLTLGIAALTIAMVL